MLSNTQNSVVINTGNDLKILKHRFNRYFMADRRVLMQVEKIY